MNIYASAFLRFYWQGLYLMLKGLKAFGEGRPAGPAFRPGWGLAAARQGPSLAAAAAKAAGRPLCCVLSLSALTQALADLLPCIPKAFDFSAEI